MVPQAVEHSPDWLCRGWLVADGIHVEGIGSGALWAWNPGFHPLLRDQKRFHGEGVTDTANAESVMLQENIPGRIG